MRNWHREWSWYAGFTIRFQPNAPVTGTWKGERYGVSLCASTYEQLRSMIDQKLFVSRTPVVR